MKKPSRRPETESRPKAKRPQTSGYGTNSKRKSASEDSYTYRAKPKATLDGGERPASRRRTTSEEDKPFKKTASSPSKPPARRGTVTKRDQEDSRPAARPKFARRDDDDSNASRPKRSGYNSGFSLKEALGRSPRPARRTDNEGESSEESDSRKGGPRKYSSYNKPATSDKPKTFGREKDFGGPKKLGDSKPYERKSSFGSSKEFSGGKKFGSKPALGGKKEFEGKREFGPKKEFGTKPAFGPKKEFGSSKRFDREKESGAPKPYGDRRENNRDNRDSNRENRFEKKRPFGENKVAGRKEEVKEYKAPIRTPDYDLSKAPVRKSRPVKEKKEGKEGVIRLNRYIANAGICSRRDADVLIQSGDIRVNGTVVTEMGHQVKPSDVVKYGNRVLNREKMVYVLLNKPKDFITTTEDPEERRTVMDLVKEASSGRLYPVGRLDRNTIGLLLLTNDGELAEKLTHPSHEISKIYEVHLDKPVSEEDLEKIRQGVELEDGLAPVDDLAVVTPDRMILGIEIHLGRNRIVRRIFEHLGYEVIKLDRVMYAGLDKKDLPRGKWRYLSEKEVIRLKYFV